LIPPKEVESFPDDKTVVISTGSQGEPLSALRRMAFNDHRDVELHSDDTVIFSATPIPGNERSVNETIDRIYAIGARVVTAKDAPIHVSGHGSREELKLMLNLTRPSHVFPFHGDHKRIHLHAELAEAVGIPTERIHRGRNGLPLEIDSRGARFSDSVGAGMIFVDGVDIGDPDDVALRDRRMLSADGVFIVVATVDAEDGSSVAAPEVIFRGVPFLEEDAADGLVDSLRDVVDESLARLADEGVTEPVLLQKDLHDDIAAFVYKRLRRRPMILPVVVEV
jgi:ribonuclease J